MGDMAKPVDVIANDLDELAAELEADAAEYRRTAASLRKRSGVSTLGGAQQTPSERQPARAETQTNAPGESQQLLLRGYSANSTGRDYSVDEVIDETENVTGVRLTKTAAQATNNRLRKSGRIERTAHGRYRLVGHPDAPKVVSVLSEGAITTGWAGAHDLPAEPGGEEEEEENTE